MPSKLKLLIITQMSHGFFACFKALYFDIDLGFTRFVLYLCREWQLAYSTVG
jgi:hypothetical protein